MEKTMGYRGMHVVDSDTHYLEEIRGLAKYLKGPAVERFADWSGQYHIPALVGDQCDVMLHGRTGRDADGRVEERYAREEADVIACPLHGWEFEIGTEECLANRRRKARHFPVETDGEDIYVILPGR